MARSRRATRTAVPRPSDRLAPAGSVPCSSPRPARAASARRRGARLCAPPTGSAREEPARRRAHRPCCRSPVRRCRRPAAATRHRRRAPAGHESRSDIRRDSGGGTLRSVLDPAAHGPLVEGPFEPVGNSVDGGLIGSRRSGRRHRAVPKLDDDLFPEFNVLTFSPTWLSRAGSSTRPPVLRRSLWHVAQYRPISAP